MTIEERTLMIEDAKAPLIRQLKNATARNTDLERQLAEVREAMASRDGAGKLCVALQERVDSQDRIIESLTSAAMRCREAQHSLTAAFAILDSRIPRERREVYANDEAQTRRGGREQ